MKCREISLNSGDLPLFEEGEGGGFIPVYFGAATIFPFLIPSRWFAIGITTDIFKRGAIDERTCFNMDIPANASSLIAITPSGTSASVEYLFFIPVTTKVPSSMFQVKTSRKILCPKGKYAIRAHGPTRDVIPYKSCAMLCT